MHCNILKVELWVILFDMNMAYDLGYRANFVEINWAKVVKLVKDPKYNESQFVDLASEIVKTKETFTSCSIVHVLCQANTMVDCFPKDDLTNDRNVTFYDSLPNFAGTSMRVDANVSPSILSNI